MLPPDPLALACCGTARSLHANHWGNELPSPKGWGTINTSNNHNPGFPSGWSILPNAIAREPRLLPVETRILIFLNSYHAAYPSHRAIANGTGLSINTIQAALRTLALLGVLQWTKGRRGQANQYFLRPPDEWQLQTRNERLGVGDRATEAKAAKASRAAHRKAQRSQ
jgi:hypothetical protein